MAANGLITIADAFETCQLGHRTDAATNQGVESAAGSLDFLEQHRIGIGRPRVGCIDGEPHLHPRRLIRSGNSRVKTQTCSRFGGAAAGVSGTSDRIIRRPFRRSSTRSILVLSKSPRPASARGSAASALLQPLMREYRPMAAPFVERGLADRVSRADGGPRSPACPTDQVRGLKAHGAGFSGGVMEFWTELQMASIHKMLNPRSIAIVGATPRMQYGGRFLAAALKAKDRVRVYAVNPRYDEIMGVKSYPSVTNLPEAPDLVGIVVPYDQVLDVLEESHRKGAGSAIVISAGFAERGVDDRRDLQG